jgi:hypothetical protein
MSRFSFSTKRIVAWQIACAVIGLAASLIPVLPKTKPFWGCNRTWTGMSPKSIGINDVLPDSPAAAAGLKNGDIVTLINGKPFNDVIAWDDMVERLQAGQEAQLKVERFAEETVVLTIKGAEPQQEAVMYYDWQLGFAGGCAAFVLLLAATQPLRPLPSLWRPILLILSGLVAIAAPLFTNWSSELFHRRWPVDNSPYPWIQVFVCLGVAILEVGLGTWEIRRIIQECQKSQEKVQINPVASESVVRHE